MAELVICDKQDLVDIADIIRSKQSLNFPEDFIERCNLLGECKTGTFTPTEDTFSLRIEDDTTSSGEPAIYPKFACVFRQLNDKENVRDSHFGDELGYNSGFFCISTKEFCLYAVTDSGAKVPYYTAITNTDGINKCAKYINGYLFIYIYPLANSSTKVYKSGQTYHYFVIK